jgi:flavorubredoxin
MVRQLDIEIIAPQHGAVFQGKEMVDQFVDWCAGLECGVDLITPLFKIPTA